jgi:hypothetical protein
MIETFEGGCACGSVRYRLASAPLFVNCCHCRECQRQTGSAFVINALIETDRVQILSGATQAVGVPTESGGPHVIHRCPTCWTALWSHYASGPKIAFVRVGTLDCPEALAPDVHIFVRTKLPFVVLPQGVPAFDAYFDIETLWPAASLERRRALFA